MRDDWEVLQDEMESHKSHMTDLIRRSKQHHRDITELQHELEKLKEDLQEDEQPISSESQANAS
jgi:chromosome segregation ATPase